MVIEKCNDPTEVTQKLLCLFSLKANEYLTKKSVIRIAIATGKTFQCFMGHLLEMNLPFEKMDLYVVDEYAGLDCDDEKSCSIDLCRDLKGTGVFHKTFLFSAKGYIRQMEQYNKVLKDTPLDIVLLGFGSDGHFAFCNRVEDMQINDTYSIVHFTDDDLIKQVKNGWFSSVEDIPRYGITITAAGALRSQIVLLAGFGQEKREIIEQILTGQVKESVPIYSFINQENVIIVVD